ncbi:uncharacterized protein N7469_009880 [Penicillium citrinum]|uniref:Peroxisomal membrane protein PEX14 n=1 Tax=Penicillium citrinum TaxID=5077 RepID=A0A9W9NJM9_PENCI|nr:uncharacterized protein N7469_009880 [Penicillium citrinum]KAJ5220993.1 hypothetical protein N7469_009880 [Penicillium citrinum]
MSDSSPKPPSIPSWQRQSDNQPTDQSSPSPTSPSPSSDDAPASTHRQDLLTQAARFLEDDSIRDSPTDRKVSFLESKGLNSDEIDSLLGITRNAEASSTSATAAESKSEETPSTLSNDQSEDTSSPSTTGQSSSTTMPQPRSTNTTMTAPASTSRDRVLYTIYGAAGLGASIYGASEYLVKPMLATLTSARHELASTAQQNLQKLNEKLERNVSVIPAHLTARKTISNDEDESNDTDSVTSDPTELFHRDIGTQTSLENSQTSLAAAEKNNQAPDAPTQAVNNHMSRLESIQSQLKEINNIDKDSSTLDDDMRNRLSDLHHYLDGLIYAAPSYSASTPSYGLYSTTSNGVDSSSMGVKKSEDEAIASFKAEIRGVKGALLSARNFPTSRGGRLGGMTSVGR